MIIMADSDIDGSHIRTLLLTLLYRQMPQLIEEGHVYIAQAPLFRIKRGNRQEYIQTEEEMNELLLDIVSTVKQLGEKNHYLSDDIILDIIDGIKERQKDG